MEQMKLNKTEVRKNPDIIIGHSSQMPHPKNRDVAGSSVCTAYGECDVTLEH